MPNIKKPGGNLLPEVPVTKGEHVTQTWEGRNTDPSAKGRVELMDRLETIVREGSFKQEYIGIGMSDADIYREGFSRYGEDNWFKKTSLFNPLRELQEKGRIRIFGPRNRLRHLHHTAPKELDPNDLALFKEVQDNSAEHTNEGDRSVIPFPEYNSSNRPKNAADFIRALIPPVLSKIGPCRTANLMDAIEQESRTRYRNLLNKHRELVPNKTALGNVLGRRNGANTGIPGLVATRGSGVVYVYSLDPSFTGQGASKGGETPLPRPIPPAPPETPRAAPTDGKEGCQGKGALMAEPPPKCIWGGAAGMAGDLRDDIVRAVLESLPPMEGPMSASRIRRRAIFICDYTKKLSRANVAAMLIVLMQDGMCKVVARHNPSRKRRVLYLWSRK